MFILLPHQLNPEPLGRTKEAKDCKSPPHPRETLKTPNVQSLSAPVELGQHQCLPCNLPLESQVTWNTIFYLQAKISAKDFQRIPWVTVFYLVN